MAAGYWAAAQVVSAYRVLSTYYSQNHMSPHAALSIQKDWPTRHPEPISLFSSSQFLSLAISLIPGCQATADWRSHGKSLCVTQTKCNAHDRSGTHTQSAHVCCLCMMSSFALNFQPRETQQKVLKLNKIALRKRILCEK